MPTLAALWDFLTSALFIAYTLGFYMGVVVGFITVALFSKAAKNNVHEGVGHGPVCTRNERAAPQAGPGGGA